MTRIFVSAAIVAATLLGATGGYAAPSSDTSQLRANVATTSGRSLSLSELAAAEFDRSSDADNQQMIVHPGHVVATPATVTVGSLPPSAVVGLAADAGLTLDQAKGMTLSELAAKKFARDNSM